MKKYSLLILTAIAFTAINSGSAFCTPITIEFDGVPVNTTSMLTQYSEDGFTVTSCNNEHLDYVKYWDATKGKYKDYVWIHNYGDNPSQMSMTLQAGNGNNFDFLGFDAWSQLYYNFSPPLTSPLKIIASNSLEITLNLGGYQRFSTIVDPLNTPWAAWSNITSVTFLPLGLTSAYDIVLDKLVLEMGAPVTGENGYGSSSNGGGTPVPLPGALVLMGTGLIMSSSWLRRRCC